jgi:hypothetical protein
LPDESHQRFVERREYGGAGFGQPLACQFADVSLRPRRIVCRRLSPTHSITLAKGLHAQSRTSFDGARRAKQRTDPDDKVNGIVVEGRFRLLRSHGQPASETSSWTQRAAAGRAAEREGADSRFRASARSVVRSSRS